jgi:stearoyl-CoA desaturase (delta-9 desaturase)
MNTILQFLSDGLLGLSGWQIALVTLVFVQVTIAGVTLYLHRCQAHRAVDLHPIVSHFFRFWLWLSTGMSTKAWVAIHRKHHVHCETENDPHSPVVHGINKLLFDGTDLYRKEANVQETLDKYGKGTPDDWMERHVYSASLKRGIFIMLAVDLLLFGVVGMTVWAVQMVWIPFWAAGVINGAAHWWGYRNFKTPDTATNLWPIAFWVGGEELHNNHHAFPGSAKFSYQKWEFDIGWMYLRILSLFGLAKVRKVAPKPVIDPSKQSLDAESIKALLTNRLAVMADYVGKVTKPVMKHKSCTGADCGLVRRAMNLLKKDQNLLDAGSSETFEKVINSDDELRTVYSFQQSLAALWEKAHNNQEAALAAVREWVQQAEQTRIKALQDFARNLGNYRLGNTSV